MIVVTNMLFGAFVYGVGEYLAGGRVIRSACFGSLGYGPLSLAYYPLCHRLTKRIPNEICRIGVKILIDQTVWSGLWNATYLGVTRDVDTVTRLSIPLLVEGWKIWPLIHIITYKYIPKKLIVYWVGMVDLMWCYIMSKHT